MGRKNSFKILKIVGKTIDGKLVIAGITKFCLTYGLALEDGLSLVKEKDCVPSWIHLYLECRKEGISAEQSLLKITNAVCDSYDYNFSYFVESELKRVFKI